MNPTLTTAEVIDIELRLTGTSLARWSAEQGLPLLNAVAMLEGFLEPRAELLSDLADALGVSGRSLRELLPRRGQRRPATPRVRDFFPPSSPCSAKL